jgi:hypothetical protein
LHFTNDFILPLDETVVVRVGQYNDSAVWDLFAKSLDLLLLKPFDHAQRPFAKSHMRHSDRIVGGDPHCVDDFNCNKSHRLP